MAESKHTLYANASQTRFYWIPDDAGLPAGDYVLRSLTGARIEVDEAAAAPFKITEDRAKELTRDIVSTVARRAGSFLSGLGALMQDVAKKQKEPPAPTPTPEERRTADTLGVTPEQLKNDPDAVADGLKRFWEGLQVTVREAIETGKEADAATRERVRKLAEAAGANLDAAETTVDDLRVKVRDFLASPELERSIDEATRRIQELAQELAESLKDGDAKEAPEAPEATEVPATEVPDGAARPAGE